MSFKTHKTFVHLRKINKDLKLKSNPYESSGLVHSTFSEVTRSLDEQIEFTVGFYSHKYLSIHTSVVVNQWILVCYTARSSFRKSFCLCSLINFSHYWTVIYQVHTGRSVL